jgi:hypothetical protein
MDIKTQEFLQKIKDSGNWNDEYAKKRKEWDEIPYEQIAKKII